MTHVKLRCLMPGYSVCAVSAINASVRFGIEKVHRVWWLVDTLYDPLEDLLHMVTETFWVEPVIHILFETQFNSSCNTWVAV